MFQSGWYMLHRSWTLDMLEDEMSCRSICVRCPATGSLELDMQCNALCRELSKSKSKQSVRAPACQELPHSMASTHVK